MIEIKNAGQRIVDTNYWITEQAISGYCFLSWNAGAGRLLVPNSQKTLLREMKNAKYIIVSRGPWTDQGGRDAIELLWEDNSDSPFAIHLVSEQCDRLIPETDQGGGFVITVWTQGGLKGRWPGKYRTVPSLPDLSPWSEH
jgi:hypothetical protein